MLIPLFIQGLFEYLQLSGFKLLINLFEKEFEADGHCDYEEIDECPAKFTCQKSPLICWKDSGYS